MHRRNLQPPSVASPLTRPALVWAIVMAALVAIGIAHTLMAPDRKALPDVFFYSQDLSVVALYAVLMALACLTWRSRLSLPAPPATWRMALLLAAAVTAFGWAGSHFIYDDYALSMDEFMARFDARILASGQLAAPVPLEWRAYARALQPLFVIDAPGNAWWGSDYLPVNAAFLALGLKLGVESLVPALWAGVSVVAVFGVARRLWPQRPSMALVAGGLLATSPQLLITAMTPYAMTAHLALNLAWLWLVLRGGRLGHGAAAGVAFLATGLHQLIFHPLFAAPFVLEMWVAKRWKPALWHTCAYAAIGAFWAAYHPLQLLSVGAASAGGAAAASGGHGVLAQALGLLSRLEFADLGYMAKNLVRFATWQSLLVAPLALAAVPAALRAGGPLRAVVLGLVLMLAAATLLMPNQGHGWGYRYLHGFLGSICLLAAWALERLAGGAQDAAGARRLLALGAAATLALALPIRAWQAHALEHPYAVAVRQIEATPADIVLVDDVAAPFASDLVRNSPFLTNRPLVLALGKLDRGQVRGLCARGRVTVYAREQAGSAGLKLFPPGVSEEQRRVEELAAVAKGCVVRPPIL